MPSERKTAQSATKQNISESDQSGGSTDEAADPELSALIGKLQTIWPRLGAGKRSALVAIVKGLLNGD